MRNHKEKQIIEFSNLAIFFALLIITPSILLLLNMVTGIGRQSQYGYYMYIVMSLFLGTIPSILSIVFGIIAFSKYHKNRHFLPTSTKKKASFALFISIFNLILLIAVLLLDTFVFY